MAERCKFYLDKEDQATLLRYSNAIMFRQNNKLPIEPVAIELRKFWEICGKKYGFDFKTAKELYANRVDVITAESIDADVETT